MWNIFSFGFIEVFDSKQKNVSERARITSSAGKITTVLKIAVESVTRELCHSHDYFCQLLTRKENRLNLIVTLKKKSCCLLPWYRIVRIVHAQTYPRKSSRLRPLRHRRFSNNHGLWCNRLQGVNKSFGVVVSCATDWSVDCVSTVISESTRTACRQETWR